MSVRLAVAEDVPAIGRVLASAFSDYPFLRHTVAADDHEAVAQRGELLAQHADRGVLQLGGDVEEVHHLVARTVLGEVVAGRRPGESPLAALRRACFEDLARRDAMLGFAGPDFVRLVTGSPTLRARLREIHEEREAALAAALAEEFDEFTAGLVAAHVVAVHRTLFREVQRRTLAGQDADEIAAALEPRAVQAFDALQRLLEER